MFIFRRPDRLKALLVLECPVVVTGNYILEGNLLGLPVEGNSTVEIKTGLFLIAFLLILNNAAGINAFS